MLYKNNYYYYTDAHPACAEAVIKGGHSVLHRRTHVRLNASPNPSFCNDCSLKLLLCYYCATTMLLSLCYHTNNVLIACYYYATSQ